MQSTVEPQLLTFLVLQLLKKSQDGNINIYSGKFCSAPKKKYLVTSLKK